MQGPFFDCSAKEHRLLRLCIGWHGTQLLNLPSMGSVAKAFAIINACTLNAFRLWNDLTVQDVVQGHVLDGRYPVPRSTWFQGRSVLRQRGYVLNRGTTYAFDLPRLYNAWVVHCRKAYLSDPVIQQTRSLDDITLVAHGLIPEVHEALANQGLMPGALLEAVHAC